MAAVAWRLEECASMAKAFFRNINIAQMQLQGRR
jgi:hypothetical protein